MNVINENKKKKNPQDLLTLPIINKVIENFSKEQENNKEIKLSKVNQTIDSLYLRIKKIKYLAVKYKKYFNLCNYKKIKTKKFKNIEKEKVVEKSIIYISIYILKDYINVKSHNNIRIYLKVLLFLMSNDILKIKNFILILNIILI